MDENNEEFKQKVSASTDDLKNETADTVRQVRENMKNVNVKEEAQAAKGFIGEMIKNPLGKINEIANDSTSKYFKTAIILVIVWMVVALLGSISFKYFSFRTLGSTLLSYIKTILAPLLKVVVMSVIIFLFNKKSKKSLITIITTVVTVDLPIIIAKVISLLTLISFKISDIILKISSLAGIISIAFLYFAIKYLCDEEDDASTFNKFVLIEAIYIVVAFVMDLLGIYI